MKSVVTCSLGGVRRVEKKSFVTDGVFDEVKDTLHLSSAAQPRSSSISFQACFSLGRLYDVITPII